MRLAKHETALSDQDIFHAHTLFCLVGAAQIQTEFKANGHTL